MTLSTSRLRIPVALIIVVVAGWANALAVTHTVYGVAAAPRPPLGVSPAPPIAGVPARRPIVVPPLVRGLPAGFIRVLPAGYRVVVVKGVRYYYVGGVHYRPQFYQGRTYYVRVKL